MVGFGYDSHRLEKGETFILGGIKIDTEVGTLAHSDGDALFHALTDALLGAAGLGDIGELFPDTDPQNKDADSSIFVNEAMRLINENNLKLINIDATIVLERPKLSAYKQKIKDNVARICGLKPERVNIKAKTNEKLGFTGRREGIAVYCVVELN